MVACQRGHLDVVKYLTQDGHEVRCCQLDFLVGACFTVVGCLGGCSPFLRALNLDRTDSG